MENKNNIQDELLSISPFIAGLQKLNLFSLPDGYFDQVVGSIKTTIHETGFMDDVAKYNSSLNVPDGYFDQLAERIINKIKVLEASENIGINEALPSLISNSNEKNIFKVPEDYFSNFSASVLKKINDNNNNEEEVSPVLQLLKGINIFETPAGYFTQLPEIILQKTTKPTAKVASFSTYRSIFKYAVAAAFIGIISFAAFKYSYKPAVINSNAVAILDESIEKGKSMDDKKFIETLNNLSEDEIAKYLDKNGSEADVAMLTSSIDENELPSQEDYLVNEKTLENFLSDIENKKSNN